MDNFLFYTLLGLTAYYFMIYLPNSKKTSPSPKSFTSASMQTSLSERGTIQCPSPQFIPDPETIQKLAQEKTALLKDQAQQERTIQNLNRSYEKLQGQKSKEIENLQSQISTLKQQLNQLTQSTKNDQQELEQTLDTLIKGMSDLSKEIDNS